MDDQALLFRQAALQREAEGFVRELGLVELFGRAGRVLQLGSAGMPPLVAPFQADLSVRLTEESRLAILRLKDVWHRLPHYPEIVSAWEIYDAVLNHEVRTLDELDDFLAARGLPTRRSSA